MVVILLYVDTKFYIFLLLIKEINTILINYIF